MEAPSSASSTSSCELGKLFVGGISWETSEETLKDYFSKYGEVTEAIIMRDKSTGTARGFGFVTFSDPSSADKTLHDTTTVKHVILGRTVEVKRAVPRGEQNQNQQHQQQHQYHNCNQHHNRGLSKGSSNRTDNNQFRTKKIFVGGLSASLTEDEFKSYFEKFGTITDVVVMYDSSTHRPRGFGFITFDSEEAVVKAVQKTFHELNGKSVEVKRAVPKDGNNNNTNPNINVGNGYNSRMGSGRGSVYGNYQGGIYPPYSPLFQGYLPPPISGYVYGAGGYGGGYALGVYGGLGYGATYASPRSPWHAPGPAGASRSPVSYSNAAMYNGYLNGGVRPYLGMTNGSYHGLVESTNGKWNQNGGNVYTPSVGVTTPDDR